MVAPTSGPTTVTRYRDIGAVGSYYEERVRRGQKPPYDLALPYVFCKCVTVSADLYPAGWLGNEASSCTSNGSKIGPGFHLEGGPSVERQQAINSAVERYRSKRSESAELLVTLIQRQEAMSMLSTRAIQLLTLAAAVASKDYRRVGRAMGRLKATVPSRKTWRGVSKDFSSAWLELSYGWIPLVKDIGSSVSLLEGGISDAHIRVRGRKVTNVVKSYRYNESWEELYSSRRDLTFSCTVGADIRVTNPNLALASALGFTNPLTVAWELVPFSFIVDWFIPVQGFLQNFSSSHGIEERNAYHTVYCRGSSEYTAGVGVFMPPFRHKSRIEGVGVERKIGIPDMTLTLRPPFRLSAWRAANAISLLVGFLKNRG